MSIRFPLKERLTPTGPVLTPLIEIPVNTVHGWKPWWFLLDTGADFTAVPKAFAPLVGIDLSRCPKTFTTGIEGRPCSSHVGTLTLRFAKNIHVVQCHFLEGRNAPYLLGRVNIFDRFNIHFQNDRREITFVPYKDRSNIDST